MVMTDVQVKASRAHWQAWNYGVTMTLVDRCMPTFDHRGKMLPGVVTILTDLVAMSKNLHATDYARKLARFQQHLLPHAAVVRIFSMWKESPANANAHSYIPDDLDLQKAAFMGLINGALDQRWAMIADAHVSYRLYWLYRRLVERALDSIPAALGNRDSRAKMTARLELVTAIHGANSHAPKSTSMARWCGSAFTMAKTSGCLSGTWRPRWPTTPTWHSWCSR